eukprot:CAMPEP_0113482880 /NCGR_PEP_ID=MMETSP0014_2-20120614/23147_1 /TAXON_ID=2857 /ORGANISM="Nitzschia sp." /LENGTH=165 /DNA_ID=CAMNT_0000376411 /DNA_START=113 /DNA_END=610 /DNA_ORIENTATION=- /assembly_acc=CAM_ASM_000159
MGVSSSPRQPPFYVATADVALSKVHPERRGSGSSSSSSSTFSDTTPASCNKKRSMSQCGSFDLTDLVQASQEVEESIAFPIVRFPSLVNSVTDLDSSIEAEAEDESDDSDTEYFTNTMPSRKRHCRGLVRCQRSYDLSTMVDMMNDTTSTSTMFTERRGSAGSMA